MHLYHLLHDLVNKDINVISQTVFILVSHLLS